MPPSFGEPSHAAQNLLFAMSGIRWPKLRWQVTETGQAQFLDLARQVTALRAELLSTMEQVARSGASGATITAWMGAMVVLVGDAEERGALPELEELLGGTSEFIGTLGEEARHLETMLLVIVMALLMELLHLLWESIFNPVGAAIQWAALLLAGRNLVIEAVLGFIQAMFGVLKPFIVGQAVSILFQVGVEFFTQLLDGHWNLDKLGKAAAAGAAAGLPMPLVSMALGALLPRLQRIAGQRGALATTVRELGAASHEVAQEVAGSVAASAITSPDHRVDLSGGDASSALFERGAQRAGDTPTAIRDAMSTNPDKSRLQELDERLNQVAAGRNATAPTTGSDPTADATAVPTTRPADSTDATPGDGDSTGPILITGTVGPRRPEHQPAEHQPAQPSRQTDRQIDGQTDHDPTTVDGSQIDVPHTDGPHIDGPRTSGDPTTPVIPPTTVVPPTATGPGRTGSTPTPNLSTPTSGTPTTPTTSTPTPTPTPTTSTPTAPTPPTTPTTSTPTTSTPTTSTPTTSTPTTSTPTTSTPTTSTPTTSTPTTSTPTTSTPTTPTTPGASTPSSTGTTPGTTRPSSPEPGADSGRDGTQDETAKEQAKATPPVAWHERWDGLLADVPATDGSTPAEGSKGLPDGVESVTDPAIVTGRAPWRSGEVAADGEGPVGPGRWSGRGGPVPGPGGAGRDGRGTPGAARHFADRALRVRGPHLAGGDPPRLPGPSGRDHPRHDDRQPGGRATGQGAGQGSRPGHGQGAGRVRCPDPARARRQREQAGPGPAPWPAALPQAARRSSTDTEPSSTGDPSWIEDGSREQGDRSATPVRTIEVGRTRSGSNRRETRMRRLFARLAGTSATRTDGTHGTDGNDGNDGNDGEDATPGHDEFTLFLDTRAGELVHEIVHGFGVGDPGLGLPGRRRPARTIDLMSTPVAADGGVSPLAQESVIEVLQRIDDGNRDPEGDHRPGDPGDPEHPGDPGDPGSTHSGPDRRLAPGLRGRPAPRPGPGSSGGGRKRRAAEDPEPEPSRRLRPRRDRADRGQQAPAPDAPGLRPGLDAPGLERLCSRPGLEASGRGAWARGAWARGVWARGVWARRRAGRRAGRAGPGPGPGAG